MIKCKLAMETEEECQMCCLYCDKRKECADACRNIEENCEEAVEETGLQIMNDAVPDVLEKITDITIQMDKLKKQEEIFRKKLVEAMEEYGVKKFENDKVSFTYKAPSTRKTFDKNAFMKEHPEINLSYYDKISKVSSSVMIKVK